MENARTVKLNTTEAQSKEWVEWAVEELKNNPYYPVDLTKES